MSRFLELQRHSNDMRLRAMAEQPPVKPKRSAAGPALRYEVYYRIPKSEFAGRGYGCWCRGGEQAAIAFAREFDRPGCWALVVDPVTFARVAEFGTRYADLKAERKGAAQAVGESNYALDNTSAAVA